VAYFKDRDIRYLLLRDKFDIERAVPTAPAPDDPPATPDAIEANRPKMVPRS
jgi:hypothetical protein